METMWKSVAFIYVWITWTWSVAFYMSVVSFFLLKCDSCDCSKYVCLCLIIFLFAISSMYVIMLVEKLQVHVIPSTFVFCEACMYVYMYIHVCVIVCIWFSLVLLVRRKRVYLVSAISNLLLRSQVSWWFIKD